MTFKSTIKMVKSVSPNFPKGPPKSLKTRRMQLRYREPKGLREAFEEAYSLFKQDQDAKYKAANDLLKENEKLISKWKLSSELNSTNTLSVDEEKKFNNLCEEIVKLRSLAEINNPSVIYNFHHNTSVDMTNPVYLHLAEQKWKSYELLVLMQRIETLHMIPDTLPTLNPRVNTHIRFPGMFTRWIQPGKIIPTKTSERKPIISVQSFHLDANSALFQNPPQKNYYTIVIVNPDSPDAKNNSFKTNLHWILLNSYSYVNNPLLNLSSSTELFPYLPSTPEKNTGNHRLCLWVFKQPNNQYIDVDNSFKSFNTCFDPQNFDIRKFTNQYNLDPVGAHLWRNKWDSTTDYIRSRHGLPPAPVYSRERIY